MCVCVCHIYCQKVCQRLCQGVSGWRSLAVRQFMLSTSTYIIDSPPQVGSAKLGKSSDVVVIVCVLRGCTILRHQHQQNGGRESGHQAQQAVRLSTSKPW